jgi:hypothetical protein
MSEAEIYAIAAAWIDLMHTPLGTPENDALFPAWVRLHELHQQDPEAAWSVILEIHRLDPSLDNTLAAGPLENLLWGYGEAFIERVEEEVYNDPSFLEVVVGVDPCGMLEDVTHRLLALMPPKYANQWRALLDEWNRNDGF